MQSFGNDNEKQDQKEEMVRMSGGTGGQVRFKSPEKNKMLAVINQREFSSSEMQTIETVVTERPSDHKNSIFVFLSPKSTNAELNFRSVNK